LLCAYSSPLVSYLNPSLSFKVEEFCGANEAKLKAKIQNLK